MTAAPDTIVSLSFAEAVTVLMEACGLESAGRAAFESRIRQLQRCGLGTGPEAPHGARVGYGIAELAAFATATRLMQAFMVPTLAARYVVERWPVWTPALLAGAAEALPAAYRARRPLAAGTVAILAGSALADMGQKGKHDERYLGPLGAIEIVADDAANMAALAKGAGLIVDCRSYMPTLVREFAALTLATEAELGAELDRLRFADR